MATTILPKVMAYAPDSIGSSSPQAFDEDAASIFGVVKWRKSAASIEGEIGAERTRPSSVVPTMARLALLAFALGSAPLTAQPTPASLKQAPAALSLFERDWVLMNWALKFYDRDRDIMLSPSEAQMAAIEFRRIADADGDGRVTTHEYRQAREFILARY
jgi:hypothetical protein